MFHRNMKPYFSPKVFILMDSIMLQTPQFVTILLSKLLDRRFNQESEMEGTEAEWVARYSKIS